VPLTELTMSHFASLREVHEMQLSDEVDEVISQPQEPKK
jgi:hypothetical protein